MFEIEILLLIVAVGPLRFFSNVGSIFDFAVINISILADTVVKAGENKHLMVILRVWRVLRLVGCCFD